MKYRLRFSKTGRLRDISHLDLMRLFTRAFRRAGVQLRYSEGFNPHPRISCAQPLSLGAEGVSEYLDIEVVGVENNLVDRLNAELPEGLRVAQAAGLPAENASRAAAIVRWADYEVRFMRSSLNACPSAIEERVVREKWTPSEKTKALTEFLAQGEIWVDKKSKKRRQTAQRTNIRPLIDRFEILYHSENTEYHNEDTVAAACGFRLRLATGSAAHLSPILALQAYFKYLGIPLDESSLNITRLNLYDWQMRPLL
jgi:radical SAM-linked protein